MTDPYRPFPSTATRPRPFPRERLIRAGVSEESVERLAGEYEGLDPQQRLDLARFVDSRSDEAIRDRFGGELPPAPVDPGAEVTYDTLNAGTVDDLEVRIREWNQAHPDDHLSTTGRKAELIGRLLDAYEGERTAAAASSPLLVDPAATPTAPAPADVVLPTAPTEPTAGGPAPTTTTDAAGAGSTTTPEGTTTT